MTLLACTLLEVALIFRLTAAGALEERLPSKSALGLALVLRIVLAIVAFLIGAAALVQVVEASQVVAVAASMI